MPKWGGESLEVKRSQCLSALREVCGLMEGPDDWIALTEIAWQLMSHRVSEAQLDVLRHERFGNKVLLTRLDGATDRVKRFERFKRVLRVFNFFLKCWDVDWDVFLSTVVDLAQGRVNVEGLDSSTRRDQPDGPPDSGREGHDDSAAG